MNIIANVKCKYCGQQFDRNKINHYRIPSGTRFRYSHIDCYLNAKKINAEKADGELVELDSFLPCIYCNKLINLKTDRYVQIQTNKFAHYHCFEEDQKKDKSDKEKLDEYIMKLFDLDFVSPKIQKQIEKYTKEQKYTLTGILSTLKYFYEVKKNSIEDSNDGIGIVPYVYEEAKKYYYTIYMTNLQNSNKHIQDYIPKKVEIKVTPKRRTPWTKKKFFMVDEDEVLDE